ncbi:MAG: histidine phosphatase family protein [Planctomycetota bacterium]|jgi:probable phosphoglycerate mutase
MARVRNTIVITLIEAGATAWCEASRLLGAADLPLTDAGRAAAAEAATLLQPSGVGVIHHPPDESAAETAAIIAAANGLKTKAAEDLANPHLGLLEGLTHQAFAERYPKRRKQLEDDPLSMHPPEGEALDEARGRLFGAVARLVRKTKAREIALVGHPMALGLLRAWLADCPARDMLTLSDGRPTVERYVVTSEMIHALESVATAEPAGSG